MIKRIKQNMPDYERAYLELIEDIIDTGTRRQSRNGEVISTFAKSITFSAAIPLLLGRKIFYKGIFGELETFLHADIDPITNVKQFKANGCNYWDLWAGEDDVWAGEKGRINIDYGNLWFNFEGVNQWERVANSIMHNPTDRRLIINSWHPAHIDTCSLPCCHFLYQFYVEDSKLHMIWYQRSADVMIGIPSDMVLAAMLLKVMANYTGMEYGSVTMHFGDTHIYAEHEAGVIRYIKQVTQVYSALDVMLPMLVTDPWARHYHQFNTETYVVENYLPAPAIKFELKA
jgi:thymidylate synthase